MSLFLLLRTSWWINSRNTHGHLGALIQYTFIHGQSTHDFTTQFESFLLLLLVLLRSLHNLQAVSLDSRDVAHTCTTCTCVYPVCCACCSCSCTHHALHAGWCADQSASPVSRRSSLSSAIYIVSCSCTHHALHAGKCAFFY